jgi:putative hydrolase of the HAD superfamily
MLRPRAVCFDMGYTLLRHKPFYQDVFTEFGVEVNPEVLELGFHEARDFYLRAVREGHDFEASMSEAVMFWKQYNAIVLGHVGVPTEDFPRIAARISEVAWSPESWEPYPEAIATLEELRRRDMKLAVISNFVDTLDAVCMTHGLTGYFDVIVSSVGAGAMKPDARIFLKTLGRLGVSPKEAWHVGDNYWADVLGARAAGMTPVFVDRVGISARLDCLAVTSLDQLLPLLDAEVAA